MSLITELPRATWLIFRMHLATTAGSRRALAGILFGAIPPLFAFLATRLGATGESGETIFMYLGVLLLLQVVAPALGVFLGIGAIADETEARTITYPFTRPIPRAAVFLGRWLASLVVLSTLLLGSGLAMAAATSGAAVIGVLFKRGQVIALGYAFAFEVLLANVPGSAQKLSLQFYLRSLFVDAEGAAWRSLELFERGEFLTPDAAALRIAITGAVLVLVGCFAVTRKQFVLSS